MHTGALRQPGASSLTTGSAAGAALALSSPITTFHGFAARTPPSPRHAAAAALDPSFEILDEDDALGAPQGPGGGGRPRRPRPARGRGAGEGARLLARGRRKGERSRRAGDRSGAQRLAEEGRAPDEVALLGDNPRWAERDFELAKEELASALEALVGELRASRKSSKTAARTARLAHLAAEIDRTLATCSTSRAIRSTSRCSGRPRARRAGTLGTAARNVERRRLTDALRALREAHVAFRAAPLEGALPLASSPRATHEYTEAKLGASAPLLDFADLMTGARDLLRRDAGARAEEHERLRRGAARRAAGHERAPGRARRTGAPRGRATRRRRRSRNSRSTSSAAPTVSVFERVASRVGGAGALTESRRGLAPLTDFVNRLFARAMSGGVHAFQIAFDAERDALRSHRGGEGACVELLGTGSSGDERSEPELVAARVRELVDAGARFGDVAILAPAVHAPRRVPGPPCGAPGVPHYVGERPRVLRGRRRFRDLVHALALLGGRSGTTRSRSSGSCARRSSRCPTPRCSRSRSPARRVASGLARRATRSARSSHRASRCRRCRPRRRRGSGGSWSCSRGSSATATGWARRGSCARSSTRPISCRSSPRRSTASSGSRTWKRLVALAEEHDEGGDRAWVRAEAPAGHIARERSLVAPAQILGEHDDVVPESMTIHQAKGLEFPIVFVPECKARRSASRRRA